MMGSLETSVRGLIIYILWTETSNLIIPRRVHWSHWGGGSQTIFACSLLGSAENYPDLHIEKLSLKGQVWSTQKTGPDEDCVETATVLGGALCCCWTPLSPEGCFRANGHMAGKFACQWPLVIPHWLFSYCKALIDGSMNRLNGETDG